MRSTPDSKTHWDNLYAAKQPHEVSWTQPVPTASLNFIHSFALPKEAPIIDIGGGDSLLVDHLLAEGYQNLTVLDISGKALAKAQQRLGKLSQRVRWIEADIREFVPDTSYALWHDRAAFHFLTTTPDTSRYLDVTRQALQPEGFLVLSTFSLEGPDRCSGLPVQQYSEPTLSARMPEGFTKMRCIQQEHYTPFQTTQSFLFCAFRRAA
ncbi:Methyltransferase domain-containing protein [Hymenobacter gelipurpurascens]|uniref:Methyltransferase domain-containing protein n=1 Tax=Hymenobacter gelipurpurascens TaxID=89968 RepID=A0A212TE50_9BACT|nr:class I SAM-dependent methyltransferase [Hymenobacter gelipurpurascens]SNC64245.1 Methyltransferase domain-containing protein [Hymenobacter gelipurpurascens]